MNSIYKYNLDKETSINEQHRNYNSDCQQLLPTQVILKSNYSNFGPLDVTFTLDSLIQTFNQAVANVTIDTTNLNCPNLLIDFTGILNVTTTVSATSSLVFTLFRYCKEMRIRQPVTTFNFFVADITGGVTVSHTLDFVYSSQNDNCKDCCTYILELTSISNVDLGTITYFINGTITAFAVESSR